MTNESDTATDYSDPDFCSALHNGAGCLSGPDHVGSHYGWDGGRYVSWSTER